MHIGIILPNYQGHLNPGSTLGGILKKRGHTVSIISAPGGAAAATREGVQFVPIQVPEYESGELDKDQQTLGQLDGLEAFRFTINALGKDVSMQLRDLPKVLGEHKFDALLIDELNTAAFSVAEVLKIPFGSIANAQTVLFSADSRIPMFVTTWPYCDSWLVRLRNFLAHELVHQLVHPKIVQEVDTYRAENGLARHTRSAWFGRGLIQLAQQPSLFEFPRSWISDHFFYTSPWHQLDRDAKVEFPWDKLDGRPLLYASLGTLQNKVQKVFCSIAEACADLNVQLVITLGRPGGNFDIPQLPKGAIVVDFAPQLQVLRKATAAISHCGMNTALEVIACGIPLVAVPITNDQPGVAARLVHVGMAKLISPPKSATPQLLRSAIQEVLDNPRYRQAAKEMQRKVEEAAPSHDQTAELIEVALIRKNPLSRDDPEAIRILGGRKVIP